MSVDFCLLADRAALDIVLYKDCHARPPVLASHELQCSKLSWVTHGAQVVVASYNFSPKILVGWHVASSPEED